MPLQIYVYDAAAYDEPELVEELDDLEEAVARCHDLVENDGHGRAEAWDADGDCRYGVAQRGGVVRTYGLPRSDDETPVLRASLDRPTIDRVADRAPVARADVPPAVEPAAPGAPGAPGARADGRAEARHVDAPPTLPPQLLPPQLLLGEKPARPDQWFG